ncbi:MAG: hypothetical protein L0Z62_26030 [Gemmataceae bacterium]|nr:hypothetical protein [Gemmataceae bacterium]
MSTFYVLPPRPLPARSWAAFLGALLPGLNCARLTWGDLAEVLGTVLRPQDDVYLLHREDLPEGDDPADALIDGFGAEPGDEVVEVPATGGATPRRWRLGTDPSPQRKQG